MTKKPIKDQIKRLRQRRRANGSWRIWWEPEASIKSLGFDTVVLDAGRLTWSTRQAAALNSQVERARTTGARVPERGARTMSALIDAYKRSRKFKSKADKTRQDYATKLRTIDAKWGHSLVTEFSKPVMHEWYETLYENNGKWQAIALLRMMSVLFSYAEIKGWRPENSNPCFRLQMQTPAPRKRFATWAEFDALVTAADQLGLPAFACALGLSALCGARETDVIIATCDGFKDMTIRDQAGNQHQQLIWEFVRSKRSNLGVVPVHNEVAPRVRALLTSADTDKLLQHAETGLAYTVDSFNDHWLATRNAAATQVPTVMTLQFRDFRRTFGIWSRAGGASKADVGDVLGNSAATDPQLGETYMPAQLDTVGRAVAAIKRPPKAGSKTG